MILHGDCLERMKEMADNSIDSVVTDPPYGLSFMGKKWDYDVPSMAVWTQCFRVLKPGGHLLSFGGTRTYHRLVVAIEDAGFEIRDQIQWIYGSGFPKSHDVSKAIDKLHGAEREVVGETIVRGVENGHTNSGGGGSLMGRKITDKIVDITAPATPDAIKWQGWGSALKPAHEPICLARKPLEHAHTIAANVLKHGTGALNIDASRVGSDRIESGRHGRSECESEAFGKKLMSTEKAYTQGRWPANLILGCACEGDIHDDECPVAMLDAQSGNLNGPWGKESDKGSNAIFGGAKSSSIGKNYAGQTGGASRFFKVIKQDKYDTVRPCTDGVNVENFAKTDGLDSVQGRALPKRALGAEANIQCEITAAPIVENDSQITQETGEAKKPFAQRFVTPNIDLVNQDQNARFVANFADVITTSIAQNIAAMPPVHVQELIRCLVSMPDSKNSTQHQSLASDAESADNTDTILTIQSLLKLSGCVLPAIEENINSANLKSDNAPTRFLYQAKASKRERNAGLDGMPTKTAGAYEFRNRESGKGQFDGPVNTQKQNHHPTVKPIRLMEYLIRLITPHGGRVLDPFAGSGSTGVACKRLGFEFIGIELDEAYAEIAQKRIEACI